MKKPSLVFGSIIDPTGISSLWTLIPSSTKAKTRHFQVITSLILYNCDKENTIYLLAAENLILLNLVEYTVRLCQTQKAEVNCFSYT